MCISIEELRNQIEGVDGAVLAAGNSDGKTKILKELAQSYYKGKFQCIYIPEYIKDLDTDIDLDTDLDTDDKEEKGVISNTGVKKDLTKISEILDERIYGQKNDELRGTIPHLLNENKESPIFNFFKDKLKFQLLFDTDGSLKIKRNEKRTSEKLTSTGFKLMIRITAEIYFYLKSFIPSETTYILVDEIDDKLYWDNRSIFFKELFKFLKINFPNIKFIFSTNMPESIYSLPRKLNNINLNFKIVKIFQNENSIISYQSYDSSDFLTENSIDKVIFDKKTTFIDKSENYKKLEEIYMSCFKCKTQLCKGQLYYCYCPSFIIGVNDMTSKEKILYDAITELRR